MVELLVVIAIIGILVAMLLPAIQAAREAARRSACQNNFQQVGLGLHNYVSSHGVYPPGVEYSVADGKSSCPNTPKLRQGYGWATYVLPYLEEQDTYDMLEHDPSVPNPVWSDKTWEASATLILTFVCPSERNTEAWVDSTSNMGHGSPEKDWRLANMAGVADNVKAHCWAYQAKHNGNGILFNFSKISPGRVTDGTSQTFIVGESVSARGIDLGSVQVWVGHSWLTRSVCDVHHGVNGPGSLPGGRDDLVDPFDGDGGNRHDEYHREHGFSSWHPGGAHFLMGDGSVQFISENTHQLVLYARATRNGGETVSGDSAYGVEVGQETPPPR